MSRAISEESLQDSRYKTIQSEQQTRHPTTTKKKRDSASQFQRTQSPWKGGNGNGESQGNRGNPFRRRAQSLRQSLNMLEYRKMRYLEEENFRKATDVEMDIKRTKSLLTQAEMNRLKKRQVSEDQSIRSAYTYELQQFKTAWSRHLQRSKEKEKERFTRFSQERTMIVEQARARLVKKCQSLKKKSVQLMGLQREAEYFRKQGDIRHLSLIKLQRSKLKEKIRQQRQGLILQWTREQQSLVNRRQSRKYTVLLSRLRQQRKDQQRAYQQQKARLKQKFKNVMSQLKHEQRMVLTFATMRLDQVRL